MKKNLLLFLLFITGALSAQVVNIPDANLKFLLLNYNEDDTHIDVNNDNEIQISEAESMTTLQLQANYDYQITNLTGLEAFVNLTSLTVNLTIFSVDINQTGGLVFPYIENLTSLFVTAYCNVDISTLVNLEHCGLSRVSNESFDFTNMPGLRYLGLGYAENLTSVNLNNNTNLIGFSLVETPLTNLDFSGCPNLEQVSVAYMGFEDQDIYINLKNGNTDYTWGCQLNVHDCGDLYLCIDEGEEENITANNSVSDVFINSYCNFAPGGNYNTITGTIAFDGDSNGCNSADIALPFTSVEINDGTDAGYAFSSTSNYAFYTQAGTFTVSPQFENDWFTASPATVTFADNNNNVTTQNFCVTANGVHNDVEVVIVPVTPAVPGFDAVYKVIYTNKGNQTLSGDVTFAYDDTVLDYVTASPVEASSAAGSLTWVYSSLLPFESGEVTVILNVNSPMETPAVNIDDELEFSAEVTPLTGDETPWNNTFADNQIVVGSYDPNDITCLEGEDISPNYIGEYLHYNINFENTGTYPATFVVVKDIIDETKFDVSTLQVVNASHDMEARVTGNKVEFYFDDINLAANGGKGNVTFKIKTLESVEVNSSVTQQAEIFFDYNWPIETNEAITTFSVLNAGVFDKDASIKVYPNPAGSTVTVSTESELQHIELYDVQGRLLQSAKVSGTQAALDMSTRAGGVYFVKVNTEKGTGVEKVIKL
jgi:uncharacterized repeat protein (TIGR01451 family)